MWWTTHQKKWIIATTNLGRLHSCSIAWLLIDILKTCKCNNVTTTQSDAHANLYFSTVIRANVYIYMIYTWTRTVGLLGIWRRLRERSLARKGLLEGSTKAGGEVVGCSISKSSRHTHGTCAKWHWNTAGQQLVKVAWPKHLQVYDKITNCFILFIFLNYTSF